MRDGAGNNMRTARQFNFRTETRAFRDFVGPSDRNDFYRFRVSRSQNLSKFSLRLSNLQSNADVFLLNARGRRVASSLRGGTRPEQINNHAVSPGVYYIRVFHRAGQGTRYRLTMSLSPPVPTSETYLPPQPQPPEPPLSLFR